MLAELALEVDPRDEELALAVVQLCNAMTGRPLTDDELGFIAAYPRQLALLFPEHLPQPEPVVPAAG